MSVIMSSFFSFDDTSMILMMKMSVIFDEMLAESHNIQIHSDSGFFRVHGLCTFGPHSFSQHFVKQTFQ